MTNLIQDRSEKPQTHEEEEIKCYEGSSWRVRPQGMSTALEAGRGKKEAPPEFPEEV